MLRSLLTVLLALATALPAFSQVRARVSTDEVRQTLTRPDVRADIRQHVRGSIPAAAEISGHEIDPAHLRDATSDEGPMEMGPRPPQALIRQYSADQARALLSDANVFQFSAGDAPVRAIVGQMQSVEARRTTPQRTTPQRANPQRTNPQRANPRRTNPQRANPAASSGSGQIAAAPQGPQLDVLSFCAGLHNALKDDVNGYVMRLAKNGQPIATLQWNWARRPGDGGVGWTPQRRMHVASVSKLITAIAAVDLLHDKGISYDAPIGPYLPTYWDRGANVNQITFRELLTHRSGIEVPGSSTNYATMKAEIAAGVPASAGSQYENTNFGLFRILIPIINGDVDKNALSAFTSTPIFESIADNVWDIMTVNAYQAYVNAKVFAPSGVAGGPGLTHTSGDAIAYDNPWSSGWDSGNLRSVSGGAGWIMSADQVLSVMAHFRHTNSIVPPSVAYDAMEARLGLDVKSTTPAGTLYNKNGLWRDGSGRTEQSLAYFLPDGMELVVLTNSPVTEDGLFFRSLVTNLYTANLN